MAKKDSLVHLAAAKFGCKVEELLSYREYEDGKVVIIAPTGQKFTYSGEELVEVVLNQALIEMIEEIKAPDLAGKRAAKDGKAAIWEEGPPRAGDPDMGQGVELEKMASPVQPDVPGPDAGGDPEITAGAAEPPAAPAKPKKGKPARNADTEAPK